MIKKTGLGIWLFLALSGLGIGVFSAFDNFYFRELGYSVAFIGALTAAFNISVAVSEIPSAIVFDRRSHWAAIQLGNAIRTIGLFLFFLSLGPLADLSAEVLAGIGAAAMSGTSTAFILNRLGDSSGHERRTALGHVVLVGSVSSLVGAGIGLTVFRHESRFIWLVSALFMVSAGLIFFLGRKNHAGHVEREVEPLAEYLRGLRIIAGHPKALLSVCAEAALVAPFLLWQLRLGATSLLAILAGFAIMKLAGVFGSRILSGKKVSRRTLFGLLIGNLIAILLFAISSSVWLIVIAFGGHVMLHIAISIYCQSEFQSVVKNSQRAGATSVVSLLSSFVTGGAAILVGVLADNYTLLVAVIPSFILYGLVGAIAGFHGIRNDQKIRRQHADL